VPLYLLYEGAILASWIIDRRRTPSGDANGSPLTATWALLASVALWKEARLGQRLRPSASRAASA